MNKRTNLQEKIFEYIIKSIIPITLAIVFVVNGFESSFNHIVSATAYMIHPENLFEIFAPVEKENSEEISKETVNTENAESINTFANINSVIPSDIQKLVVEAEKKYANSSNDG